MCVQCGVWSCSGMHNKEPGTKMQWRNIMCGVTPLPSCLLKHTHHHCLFQSVCPRFFRANICHLSAGGSTTKPVQWPPPHCSGVFSSPITYKERERVCSLQCGNILSCCRKVSFLSSTTSHISKHIPGGRGKGRMVGMWGAASLTFLLLPKQSPITMWEHIGIISRSHPCLVSDHDVKGNRGRPKLRIQEGWGRGKHAASPFSASDAASPSGRGR